MSVVILQQRRWLQGTDCRSTGCSSCVHAERCTLLHVTHVALSDVLWCTWRLVVCCVSGGGLLHRKLHSRCWMQQSGLCTIPCVSFSVSSETDEKGQEPGRAGGLLLRVLLVTRPQPFFQQWQELPCSNCLCPCSIPAPLRSALDTC